VAVADFVDSSALVKRYVLETGTAWVRGITRKNPSTVIYIAHITAVEVRACIRRRPPSTKPRFDLQPLSPTTSGIDACRMMKRRLNAVGLPRHFSPHSFRVATVTDLLQQNVPLDDVPPYCLL